MTSDHIGTDDRPRDALSAAHAESRAVLVAVVSMIERTHARRGCRSVDGCPWPIFTDLCVHELYDQLIAAGYQVVPI